MARISYSSVGASPFRRLVGHNPELLRGFEALSDALNHSLQLPGDLREEVRRHLAYERGCVY
jgi:alkylhydroperoxidase family enzyme